LSLELALSEQLPIHLVVARANGTETVDIGLSAATVPKTFSASQHLIGSIVSFDGDEFIIDFRKKD